MGVYRELHSEFALRTKANLEYIEAAWDRREPNVYNVTQLINSCLGMVVFIKECGYVPQKSIKDFCPDIEFETIRDCKNSNASLEQFLKRFRNAISHCNIEAYGTPSDIKGFILHDGPKPKEGPKKELKKKAEKNWIIQMETNSIRALALALVDHVVNHPPKPEEINGL